MAKWSEYKLKETPASEDELMSYDIAGKANKRTTIGKVANNTAFSGLKTAAGTPKFTAIVVIMDAIIK